MKILFFDGHCNLCNTLVDWLIRRDKKNVLKYASLQGETAKAQLPSIYQSTGDVDTVLYLKDGKVFMRTRAVLHVLRDLGLPWSILSMLLIFPSFTLDWGYRLVAHFRYKIFGKKDTCRIPTREEREKILP
jgi:predicted DCC family thiol-disulfide oxidoreductase YuxK